MRSSNSFGLIAFLLVLLAAVVTNAQKPARQLPVEAQQAIETVRKVVAKVSKVPAARIIAQVTKRVAAPEELEYTPGNPFKNDRDPVVKEVDFDK